MEAQAAGGAVAAAGSGGFLSFLPVGLSICVGGLAVLLYMFQDKLLYFPSMPPNARTAFVPAHLYNLQNDLVETFITTKDNIKLQAYFVPNQRGQATSAVPTFLYFHGNAGNLSYRLPNVKQLVATVGVNVLIVSYRGYGKSEGTPSEEGLRLDAEAALDYLFYGGEDIDPKKIVAFGRSLGGAVALRLAADHQDKVAAVVVENTFTSIPDMIDVVLRWLSPFKFLSRNKWSSKDVVSELTMPALYLSGEKDELVPARMMRELYDRSTSSRKRHVIYFAEGTHMDTFMQPGYYEKVKSWLRSVFDQTAVQNQGEEEGEVEEVLNEEHELITSEGEEVQVALVNNTL